MSERLSQVRLDRVSKVFGAIRAVAGVSLAIEAGEVVAVMGANGAGKSTLLSMLSLNMRPTGGALFFDDEEATPSDTDLRGRIGLLSHQPLVYPDLTARENLHFFARLYGLSDTAGRVRQLEERLAITQFASDRPTRALSRGQLQRVALARAMIASPELLLLDEPAAGLDSASIGRIEAVVDDLRSQDGLAFVVTHEPELAARVATRAVMLRDGAVVHDESAPSGAEAWRELYVDTVEGGAR